MSGQTTLETANPSERAMFTALRAVLLQFLPDGIEVVRGQVNQVPEPMPPDFLVMWPLHRRAIEVQVESFHDGFFDTPETVGTIGLLQPADITVQVDVHGPNSSDNALLIQALAKSGPLADAMADITPDVSVLYADEARQTPFENAEDQLEMRWSIDVHLQVNASVTISQQFAGTVEAGLLNVDVVYPA